LTSKISPFSPIAGLNKHPTPHSSNIQRYLAL
jgi:hypothetical protein